MSDIIKKMVKEALQAAQDDLHDAVSAMSRGEIQGAIVRVNAAEHLAADAEDLLQKLRKSS